MLDQNKQNDISILPTLPKDRYENIFNVYPTNKGDIEYYFYNILKKVTINADNIDPAVFKYIQVNRRLPWTAISYQEYTTQHLWWLILAINNRNNPIVLPRIGDVLRIIRREYVKDILNQLR
jgi:hypothetical protein